MFDPSTVDFGWLFRMPFLHLTRKSKHESGWWFQIFFYFHPYLGKIPILTYFSDGLKPPTRWVHWQLALTRSLRIVVTVKGYIPTLDMKTTSSNLSGNIQPILITIYIGVVCAVNLTVHTKQGLPNLSSGAMVSEKDTVVKDLVNLRGLA